MAEYIEREAICEKCENKNSCYPFPEMRKKCPVYKASAADVAEVRHGKWVMRSNGYMCRPQCSVCGGAAVSACAGTLYCPHCGAQMDGNKKKEG